MLFNILCILLCGVLSGIIIGLVLARSMITRRIFSVEDYWKQKIIKINDDWRNFHTTELNKWQEKTSILVNKTYHDAVEERDKAWQQRFNGTKPKSKPPTN